jgi:hypothetical protein
MLVLACGKKTDTQETGEPNDTNDSGDTDDTGDTGDTDDTGDATDLCADNGWLSRDWKNESESEALYATAADFTIATTTGDWTFSEHFTGCETLLFITDDPRQTFGWPTGIWERDIDTLFERLPRNTHLFFISTVINTEAREQMLADMQTDIERELSGTADEAWWLEHVHYVPKTPFAIGGWISGVITSPGWGLGIDRFQRIRYIGSYADPTRYSSSAGWFAPNLSMVANEVIHYNFESDRAELMEAEGADVVPIFTGERVGGSTYVEVDWPDTSAYDTMSIDLYMGCEGDGEYGDCPAWDYMAYLYLCEDEVETNPHGSTSCQEHTPEVMGTCLSDGTATSTTCREVADCEDSTGVTWTCDGYEAEIAADRITGACLDPYGDNVDRDYVCNDDGTGYDDIACGCSHEVGRWITTYHREGRWVYDNSSMLPMLARSGKRTFRFNTTGPYEIELDLRLSNQGKATRPDELIYLFDGGRINSSYNANHPPMTIDIPSDATKVELASVITGHNADGNNCAEFCDIAHHFTINDNASGEIVREFPESEGTLDCQDKVAEGTTPNQYGTWWYGRAGWCPGKEAATDVVDITDQVTKGAANTFAYKALYNGGEYTGDATIRMRSWLVISR